MARNYWKTSICFFALSILLLAISPVSAKESLSSYFVKITDASQALKNGNQEEAKALVREMATDFEEVEHADSDAGRNLLCQGRLVKKI